MILNSDTFMASVDGRVEISTTGGPWMTIKVGSQVFTVPTATIKVNEFADAIVKGGR